MATAYCPRNTYCTDAGCCSIFYTLKQCGGHEVQNYESPGQKSSTTRISSSTSFSSSSTSSMTSGSAQATSAGNSNEKNEGNGVSKKISAIVGGVVGGLAVVGAVIIGVVWMVLRSRTTATPALPAAVSEGQYNSLDLKGQAYESDGSGRVISRSVMGFYAPSAAISSIEAAPNTPSYALPGPRRVTELDAERIYRMNPASASTVDAITSVSGEAK
ncbi:hypothetical protein MauCBS54593_001599 [Microsporum audouinii]